MKKVGLARENVTSAEIVVDLDTTATWEDSNIVDMYIKIVYRVPGLEIYIARGGEAVGTRVEKGGKCFQTENLR